MPQSPVWEENEYVIQEVKYLLSLGYEGAYWDYKSDYPVYNEDKLLDIICMANNLENRTAYLLYGVNNDGTVCGIENTQNTRYDSLSIIKFLRDKPFAGGFYPQIKVSTMRIEGHEIDILSVFNSSHTPYYLDKDYFNSNNQSKKLRAGSVYTRTGDGNTDRNRTASFEHTDILWRKRFGIDLPALERLNRLLDETDKWVFDWGNKNYAFHKDYPEFRMVQDGELQYSWYPSAAFYTHPSCYSTRLNIMYHSTIIHETEIWVFDEYRKYLPRAMNACVSVAGEFWYSYYDLSSVEGKMLTIFTGGTNNISSREPNYNQLLVFANREEKEDFDSFLDSHFYDYDDVAIKEEFKYQIQEDCEANGGGLVYTAFMVAKASKMYCAWKKDKSERDHALK